MLFVVLSPTLFFFRQEQCCFLVDLMREYQRLKSIVTKAIEVASNLTMTKPMLKDREDVRWALSKVILNIFI